MTRVRFIKPYGRWTEGHEAELFGGVAATLIRRGFCKRIAGEEIETAESVPTQTREVATVEYGRRKRNKR